jgi:hypothetical protein
MPALEGISLIWLWRREERHAREEEASQLRIVGMPLASPSPTVTLIIDLDNLLSRHFLSFAHQGGAYKCASADWLGQHFSGHEDTSSRYNLPPSSFTHTLPPVQSIASNIRNQFTFRLLAPELCQSFLSRLVRLDRSCNVRPLVVGGRRAPTYRDEYS